MEERESEIGGGCTICALSKAVGDGESSCSTPDDNIVVGREQVGGIADMKVARSN